MGMSSLGSESRKREKIVEEASDNMRSNDAMEIYLEQDGTPTQLGSAVAKRQADRA